MASFWTKLADFITPWDRGGERKRREEEAARRQATIIKPTAQPVVDTAPRQNQTIGGQQFNLLGSQNNSVSVPVRRDYDMGRVDQGLDAGKSWEDISRETGTDLNAVREYSQRTRPEYGIPKSTPQVASNPRLGTPGQLTLDFFKPTQQAVAQRDEKARQDFETKVAKEAETLRTTPYKESTLRKITNFLPVIGSIQEQEKLRGLTGASDLAQKVAIARATGMTLDEIDNLNSEQYIELFNQVERARTLANLGVAVDIPLSLVDIATLGGTAMARGSARAAGREILQNMTKDVAKRVGVGAGVGAGVSAGAQQYMTGDIDPAAVFRAALQTGIIGAADPFNSIGSPGRTRRGVDVPAGRGRIIRDFADERGDIDVDLNTPAYQRRGGAANTVTEAVEDVVGAEGAAFQRGYGGKERPTKPEPVPVTEWGTGKFDTPTFIKKYIDEAMTDWKANNPDATPADARKARKQLEAEARRLVKSQEIDEVVESRAPVENTDIPVDDEVGAPAVRTITKTDRTAEKTQQAAAATPVAPPDARKAGGAAEPDVVSPSTMPRGESEFLQQFFTERVAPELTRAQKSLRTLKKERSTDRSERAARYQAVFDKARAEGKSYDEAERLATAQLGGAYGRADFEGSGFDFDTPEGKRIEAAIDRLYEGRVFDRKNTRDAFDKVFNYGRKEGYNTLQSGDIKKIRKFFNQMAPDAKLGREVEQAIKDLDKADPTHSTARKVMGLQRALLFTADAGTMLRQTLPAGTKHPVLWAQSVKDGFKAMFSNAEFEKMTRFLETDKVANYANDRMKLDLTMLDGAGEEQFRNADWASKLPGAGRIVDASQRFFDAQTNMMRYYNAKKVIEGSGGIARLEKIASETGNPDNFMQAWGRVINNNTGRGEFMKLGSPEAGFLSEVFNSPRGLAAKLNRSVNPRYYARLAKDNPAAFKEAVGSLVTQGALTASILGVAAANGDYEDGKIRIGDTRYDITGGVATIYKTLKDIGDFALGNAESTPFANAGTEIQNWIKNQMTPAINTAWDLATSKPVEGGEGFFDREDAYGNQMNPVGFMIENLLPLGVQGVITDSQEGTSPVQTAVNAGVNALGVGVNTYQSSQDKKDKANTKVTEEAGNLAKYFPEGEDLTSKKVISGAVDDAFWESDWEAYAEGRKLEVNNLKNDPNSKRDDIKRAEMELRRADVLKQNPDITAEEMAQYLDIGVELWRKMGDPDSEDYNPELYQRLYDIDQAMLKNSATDNTTAGKKWKSPKFVPKKSGGGGGRGGGSIQSSSFGTYGTATPDVRQYDMTGIRTGRSTEIPVIRRVRPNIVHKITKSG